MGRAGKIGICWAVLKLSLSSWAWRNRASADKQAGLEVWVRMRLTSENRLPGGAVRTMVWTCLFACGFGPHSRAQGEGGTC